MPHGEIPKGERFRRGNKTRLQRQTPGRRDRAKARKRITGNGLRIGSGESRKSVAGRPERSTDFGRGLHLAALEARKAGASLRPGSQWAGGFDPESGAIRRGRSQQVSSRCATATRGPVEFRDGLDRGKGWIAGAASWRSRAQARAPQAGRGRDCTDDEARSMVSGAGCGWGQGCKPRAPVEGPARSRMPPPGL